MSKSPGAKPPPGSPEFLADHGIAPEVWASRPYVRYGPDNLGPVREEYAPLSVGQRRFAVMVANGGKDPYRREHPECRDGGFLIMRHPPPGMGLDRVYAEMRPDYAVATESPRWHYHGAWPPPDDVPLDPENGRPLNPETGRALPRNAVRSEKKMRENGHLGRVKYDDDHGLGAPWDAVHPHQNIAKYVFIPSGYVDQRWEDDHSRFAGKPAQRARHLEQDHPDGVDPDHVHEHVRRVKDWSESIARRLDVHPLAVERFEGASRVYFGIEGCLKADAILTASGAVFSVPSVTLWDAAELPAFVDRYLRDKEVVIVPDADWHAKREVLAQAMLCRSFLRSLGLPVVIAAPPIDSGYKGVDDFLGAGGTLGGLVTFGREPAIGTAPWLRERLPKDASGRRPRADRVARDAAAVEGIALHSGDDGRYQGTIEKFARVVQVHSHRHPPAEYVSLAASGQLDTTPLRYDQAKDAVKSLIECGALTIEGGSLELRRNRHRQMEWADRPTFVVHEDLRSRPGLERPLDDTLEIARFNAALEAWEAEHGSLAPSPDEKYDGNLSPLGRELAKWVKEQLVSGYL